MADDILVEVHTRGRDHMAGRRLKAPNHCAITDEKGLNHSGADIICSNSPLLPLFFFFFAVLVIKPRVLSKLGKWYTSNT
jgi:hypothetical protein